MNVKRDREEGMNMTPMIDVVFLLVIFFMIVTDLTQQELEELKLPEADMAQKDENPLEKRLVVNIDKEGRYIVRRNDRGVVDDCLDEIRDELAAAASFFPRGEDGCSKQAVLIRADEKTAFEYIQKVMQICSEEPVRIRKIELGCSLAEKKESADGSL